MPQMYLRQSPEKEMRNTILILLLLMFLPVSVSAQFYTITRDSALLPTERQKEVYNRVGKDVTEGKKNEMMAGDNPPVGILLCTDKGSQMVEYALSGMDNQLFVSTYMLHLPDKKKLEEFMLKEMAEMGMDV